MPMDRVLTSILAGIGGMVGWGTSDFLANNASEKIGHSRTFLWSQIAGVTFIALLAIVMLPNFSIPLFLLLLTLFGGFIYALGYLFFLQRV